LTSLKKICPIIIGSLKWFFFIVLHFGSFRAEK
jgi:hypothetical protein